MKTKNSGNPILRSSKLKIKPETLKIGNIHQTDVKTCGCGCMSAKNK